MVYNFDSFIYDNLQKYIVKAINSRKIIFNNGENLLLQNLVEHKKLNLKTLEVLFKEKHEDLNLSYRGLKNKLIDVAKLSKVKDNTGISISIKVYDLVKVSKIEKNKTRKKFNRSTVTEKDDEYFNFDNFNYPKKFKNYKLVKIYPNFANYRDTRTNCLTSFKKQDLINY
ncbi:unknown [Clostridium sp. CAG:354]|nr:unknown [Clostridium sp. CAG:354]HIT24026.1 hypothetical protein [Candidatus Faecimonas intestinavium]